MDIKGLVTKYSDTLFYPCGSDDKGFYMLLDNWVVYIKPNDLASAHGMPLKDIEPYIKQVQTL